MPPKVKKPKVKKEKKPRVTQKQKQTQIVTVNVTAPDKPKRKRKAKPKVKAGFDPRAAGISGPVGTIGGLTPVIFAPTQPKQDDLFLDDAFKKYIKNLYTQQPQQNPLLPPSAPDLLPLAPAQPGAPALLPSAPPNVPRLSAEQTPASPLAPPPPKPSPLAPSTSDESQASSVLGSTMSLAGDAINEPPIDPLMTEDEAAAMFISELAKQAADDQSRVIAPPKPPSLNDLMKQDPLSRGDSDVSTLTDEGGAEEPPTPATASPRKPRGPKKTAEQKAQEKAEKDAAKQAKDDERAASLAAKVRGGGGGVIRMGF
jgi:hypothetical protein